MGLCCSSPDAKYEERPQSTGTRTKEKAPSRHGGAPSTAANKRTPQDFSLSSTHEVVKLLGRGGEGETWLCREKDTGTEVAIKFIKRPIPKPAVPVIKREIKIQSDLGQGHINIVSADEVLLSKTHLGLVMEYVPGGNMVNYVTKKRETKHERGGLCIDEEEARYYFLQLLSAVEYCHKNHVAHRDLKLDNTLLDGHSPPWIKLCDFGFAKHWTTNSNMDTMRIGTPEYMGPELISSRTGYDGKKVDVWAAGVLLYVMLVGMFPFETQDDNFNNTAGLYDIWLQQIKTSWRDLPNNNNAVQRLSSEVKDLLDKMFDTKQDSRIDVAGIKTHPWYNKPLLPKYQRALEELREQQRQVDDIMKTGHYSTPDRDKQLELMLDRAATAAMPTEEVSRLKLSKVKRSQAVTDNRKVIKEED